MAATVQLLRPLFPKAQSAHSNALSFPEHCEKLYSYLTVSRPGFTTVDPASMFNRAQACFHFDLF
jgi:hypothetical protein